MSGMSDKISGKAKQTIGKVTDNKELEAKGKAQELKGKAKDATKGVGEKISNKIDDLAKKTDK